MGKSRDFFIGMLKYNNRFTNVGHDENDLFTKSAKKCCCPVEYIWVKKHGQNVRKAVNHDKNDANAE